MKSEFYENKKAYSYHIADSKGYIHNFQIGGNIPLKKANIGCLTYIPIKQRLMNDRIQARVKALVYVNWNL